MQKKNSLLKQNKFFLIQNIINIDNATPKTININRTISQLGNELTAAE